MLLRTAGAGAAAPACWCQVAIRTNYWTMFNHVAIWAPLVLWLPFLAILGSLCGKVPGVGVLCGLDTDILGLAAFWLGAVLLAPVAALLLDYTIAVFQRTVRPRCSQVLQVWPGLSGNRGGGGTTRLPRISCL